MTTTTLTPAICIAVCEEHQRRFDGYGSSHAACIYSHDIGGHTCALAREFAKGKDRHICIFESDCEECW